MTQKEIKDRLKKVASKYNKPYQVIEEIFNSQFLFLKHETSKNVPDDIKTTMLPNWGKYCLMPKKLYMIRKTLIEKGEDPNLTQYQRYLKRKENEHSKDGQETNNQPDSKDQDQDKD